MKLQDPLALLWPCLAALALAAANGPLNAGDLTLAMDGEQTLKAASVGIQGNPQFVEGKKGKAVRLTKGSFLALPSRGVFDAGKGSVAV
ncbi:MAG: hypothetical protein FJ278_11335, partial [Planctomycetes bacterium]|nr:hypothetical protein [Planctomycetota bacterium]